MNVTKLEGSLTKRDADLSELTADFYSTIDLSDYLNSAELKSAKQTGSYKSSQGATITPIPFWAVEFQTSRRKVGGGYQQLPSKEDGQYKIRSAGWATDVSGTGSSKGKWRDRSLEGEASLNNLFTVATSTYLVPFALGYRYVVHIPAKLKSDDPDSEIEMLHQLTDQDNHSLGSWSGADDNGGEPIKNWTSEAQKLWAENRTQNSPERVTDRLDYHNTLSTQQPKSYRVVTTRSRKFYAAVLAPRRDCALKLPFLSAKLQTRESGDIINTEFIPVDGTIVDNKVHTIRVESEEEAYWMVGLFNSDVFEELVMEEAGGEPPGIYSIPAKILDRENIEFDSSNDSHLKLAELSRQVEEKMGQTIRDYLGNEKGIDLQELDDTDQSPEIPRMVSTAYTNRLEADDELKKIEDISESICE